MRFLRKVLLVLNLKNIILHFKGIPILLDLLLHVLYQPITHAMKDPFRGFNLVETAKRRHLLRITKLTFSSPKPFGYMKPRKKGRIKRKIRRRIMGSVFTVDEM